MPLLSLPLRTSVVETGAARVMYSPASTLSPEALRSHGEVSDVIVPNLFHLDGVRPAVQAFPKARFWLPAGAERKLPGAPPHAVLGVEPWPHEDTLPLVHLAGMPGVAETVMVDRASKTLFVADLVFNLLDAKGFGARIILGMFGTYRRFGVSRFFVRAIKDPAAFAQSARALLGLAFEDLVPAHGERKLGGAHEALRLALAERGVVLSG